MEGKKTYTSIAVAALALVLGWLGLGGETDATELVDAGFQAWDRVVALIALLGATYGRYKAKPKG